jgi:hypothetical protein
MSQRSNDTFAMSKIEHLAGTTLYLLRGSHVSWSSILFAMLCSGSMLSCMLMACQTPYRHNIFSLGNIWSTTNTSTSNLEAMFRLMRNTPTTCDHAPLELSVWDHLGTNREDITSCLLPLDATSFVISGPNCQCPKMPLQK